MKTIYIIRKRRQITIALQPILLGLTVALSIASQITPIAAYVKVGMYIGWILVFGAGCIQKKGKLIVSSFTKHFLLLYGIYAVYALVSAVFFRKGVLFNYVRLMLIPLAMCVLGDIYSDYDEQLLYDIAKVYVVASVVFAIWVNVTYFPSYSSWLQARTYLFAEKNSAGQIWGNAILLATLYIRYRSKTERVVFLILSAYLMIMIGIGQCRTSLLGIALAILVFIVYRSGKKLRWIALLAIGAITALSIPRIREFMAQALFLTKYQGMGLNAFSSNRIEYWAEAFKLFLSSPVIGTGKYYVDCSYLLILTESGIMGLILVESIWVKKIIQSVSIRSLSNVDNLLILSTVFYFIESIFEGYPPFGPGVCSFFYWFLSNIHSNKANGNFMARITQHSRNQQGPQNV